MPHNAQPVSSGPTMDAAGRLETVLVHLGASCESLCLALGTMHVVCCGCNQKPKKAHVVQETLP